MKVNVPPIKSQGIKTKLVPWIESITPRCIQGRWIEPFTGTGVVAFNLAPRRALLCDANPHLVNFYNAIADDRISPAVVRDFLEREGRSLLDKGESHYYSIRERFNKHHSPLDFLFLNRAGFNGMIRFNRKGEFNIPFCRKPRRFSQAYITKIANQVDHAARLFQSRDFEFQVKDYRETIREGTEDDIIYCDPPYIDRHVDYYNGWDENHEKTLYEALDETPSRFILSTWHHNAYRHNDYIKSLWSRFNVLTREHFYHVGGREKNRNSVTEAIVTNYDTTFHESRNEHSQAQLMPLEQSAVYDA